MEEPNLGCLFHKLDGVHHIDNAGTFLPTESMTLSFAKSIKMVLIAYKQLIKLMVLLMDYVSFKLNLPLAIFFFCNISCNK